MIIYQNENFNKRLSFRSREHENWIVVPHLHEFSELVFVKSGVLTAYVNGKKYQLSAGNGLLILPNQIHEYTAETPHIIRCAVFSNDFIPIFFETIQDKIPKNSLVRLDNAEQWCKSLEQANPENHLEIASLLYHFCDAALRNCEWVVSEKRNGIFLHDIINYVAENFKDNITLKEVAKKMGYHEKYLSAALHKLTNMNFRTFLCSYRIELAKKMLKNKTDSIARISGECGFSSINTFNRVFKQFTGKTPGEYRKSTETLRT